MIEKFELHTDVLVLGSGPSGFAAAYTAAKMVRRLFLLSKTVMWAEFQLPVL